MVGSTPDRQICRRAGELVDANQGLPLIRKRRAERWNEACCDGVGCQLQTASERGASRRDCQRRQQAWRSRMNDVKPLPPEETVEAFGGFRRLRQDGVSDREAQRDPAWDQLTLSDGSERSRGVSEGDLIVDPIVP